MKECTGEMFRFQAKTYAWVTITDRFRKGYRKCNSCSPR